MIATSLIYLHCAYIRDPHKPRRKHPSRNKERKERAPPRDKEPEIKTEGGESGDVKLENEFGEVAEPPRK